MFLHLPDFLSPKLQSRFEGDTSFHKELELNQLFIVKLREKNRELCLAGLTEVIIQVLSCVFTTFINLTLGTNL